MALTEQEKQERLAKLREHANWWSFTDSVRAFLAYMAEGLEPLDAGKKAYPDCKNAVVMVKSLLARVGIQSALESIGVDTSRANVTKAEALRQFSRFMRNAKDVNEYCKAWAHYKELQGWGKSEDDSPREISLDDMVAAMSKGKKK